MLSKNKLNKRNTLYKWIYLIIITLTNLVLMFAFTEFIIYIYDNIITNNKYSTGQFILNKNIETVTQTRYLFLYTIGIIFVGRTSIALNKIFNHYLLDEQNKNK